MAMRRTNTFCIQPRTQQDRELLTRLLDASASLWNQLNFERRQQFFDGESIWETADYRRRYVNVLGSATAQQVIRKNDEAWRSFFALKEQGEANGLPGYWGNEEDGRELRTAIRNDQYSIKWGDSSTIEISVGKALKEEYGFNPRERLTLEVYGDPKWTGKQGRLELYYDELGDQFRAHQPVTVDELPRDPPVADELAALDIGANNLVACTTTTGQRYLYAGRDLFERFHATTQEIARLQSLLEEGQYSSKRIRRLYRRRTRRRDHAMDTIARDLLERLYEDGVSTLYVGDLTDVLTTHWSVVVNEKTHTFWAFRAFIQRLACTAEVFGITLELRSEAWTSRECPECKSTSETIRQGDWLRCRCGFEGHADLTASEMFLRRHEPDVSRPMARPVCCKWDDHHWSASSRAPRPNAEHTNPQVTAEVSA
jgi:putative transposase